MSMGLEELLREENELELSSFSNEDAFLLGQIIMEVVREKQYSGIAISIERNKELLLFHLMEGTGEDNISWCRRKKNVVDRYGHSSLYIGEKYIARGTSFEVHTKLSPTQYQAVGGSIPVILKGTGMIGSVTVSGLTAEQDHQVCAEGMRRLIKEKESNKK